MKKLRLDPDALRIESFEASDGEARPGTVRGHEGTYGETCITQCATGPCECMITVDEWC